MSGDRLIFSTKIDMWLLVLLLGSTAACAVVIAQFWTAMSGPLWWAGILLAVGALFPVWILLTTRYAMSDSELFVRCGPFAWTVPISEISATVKTNSPLSSPALSLDRLRIEYGGGRSIMISPEPRKAFLQQLEYRRQMLADTRGADGGQ